MVRKRKKRGKKTSTRSLAVKVKKGARPAFVTSLSVTAKIVLFSAIVYLFALSIYLLGKWYFFFRLPEEMLGMPINWVTWAAQIFILAMAATIGTKLFLIDPINKMKEAIKEVRLGDLMARADLESGDELGDLAYNFDQLLTEITELNDEKVRTEHELLLAYEAIKHSTRFEKKDNVTKEANKNLEALVKDFSLLYEIGQRVNSTIEMDELYRVLQDVLPERLGLQKFAILLADEKREFLNINAAHGFGDLEKIYDMSFRMGEGVSGEVASKGELIYLPDVEAEPKFLHYRGESVEKGSFVSVPLKYKRDILGVMNCSRTAKNGFTEDEIRLITLVANQIALSVENAKLYTKTRELSVRDELTNLYNRRHFQQVMQMEWKRATRFKRPLSLLMIDIDNFKAFNDNFGHLEGDRALKIITALLAKNLREVDTIARFGGEEFVVLLPDTDKGGAMVVGEKLRHLVESERLDEGRVQVASLTISVGVSSYLSDAKEMDDLIDHADVALYEAKDGGRNRVVIYADASELSQSFENAPTIS